MVNGYVNIPSELSDLTSFIGGKVVPGIYNNMIDIIATNKPAVGNFSLQQGPIRTSAIFFPVVYHSLNDIYVVLTLGNSKVSLIINSDDNVFMAE